MRVPSRFQVRNYAQLHAGLKCASCVPESVECLPLVCLQSG